MRKGLLAALAVILAVSWPLMVQAQDACTTIQDGDLTYGAGRYLEGEPLKTGFDLFGYNYQAHLFNGLYANVYLNKDGFPPYEGDDEAYYQRLVDEGYASDLASAELLMSTKWYWPYRNIQLMMKWNDAWLSNKDCDGDGKLDRHYGFVSYIGSGAWLTNHMSGGKGKNQWVYFVKIVAAPGDAYTDGGIWYRADDTEIGPVIWVAFAIIQEVLSGEGAIYVSPAGPGFGQYKP
jgi:hypothetical protein